MPPCARYSSKLLQQLSENLISDPQGCKFETKKNPRKRYVTISMVGLENSHIRKNLNQKW